MATILESLTQQGWATVGHPDDLDEAVIMGKRIGDGFYVWTHDEKPQFFGIRDGQIAGINPYGWGNSGPEPPPAPPRRLTVEEAADEFSNRSYKVDLSAALSWKLELCFDPEAAMTALHAAAPGLSCGASQLATDLVSAATDRFGDGVINRGGGDIAIRTAEIRTIGELRDFLRGFAMELLTAHLTLQVVA